MNLTNLIVAICSLLLFLFFSQTLLGQSFELVADDNPWLDLRDSASDFADIDGDGDQDLLMMGRNEAGDLVAKLYTNDGSGNFTEKMGTPFEGFSIGALSFADIDGDGDFDVLITGSGDDFQAYTKLYKNDGLGNFEEVPGTNLHRVHNGAHAFGDMDGDGDLDLVIVGSSATAADPTTAKLYRNDGNGSFSEEVNSGIASTYGSSVAFADVDNDGDLDLFVCGEISSAPTSRLYKNDGNGNFVQDASSDFQGVSNGEIAFADIDHDEDLDLLITGTKVIAPLQGFSGIYINDGLGDFEKQSDANLKQVAFSSAGFFDLDSDGDQDVILTGLVQGSFGEIALYKNDSLGNFSFASGLSVSPVAQGSLSFADIEGDGDQDVFISGDAPDSDAFGSSVLYRNLGTLGLQSRQIPNNGVAYGAVAVSDVDGNGHEELLFCGWDGANIISQMDGFTSDASEFTSHFIERNRANLRDGAADFFDMDGDNDDDLLISGWNGEERITGVRENLGDLYFGNLFPFPFEQVDGSCHAVADIDGDLDLDLFIAGSNAFGPTANIYLNNGNGDFAKLENTGIEGISAGSAAFADVDLDSDQDLLITGQSDSGEKIAQLYRNDGSGNFALDLGELLEGVDGSAIAFEDLDADGDPDLLICGQTSLSQPSSKLYQNDGLGNFSLQSNSTIEDVAYSAIAFEDIDSDGDADLLITGANSGGEYTSALYTNDAMGNFTELASSLEGVAYGAVGFIDFDGDEMRDLVITGLSNESIPIIKLYANEIELGPVQTEVTRSALEFSVYPNPVNDDLLLLKFPEIVPREVQLNIFDSTGALLLTQATHFKGKSHRLDVSALPSGIYLLTLHADTGQSSRRFVIE